MKKIIRLTENDLMKLVKRVINEQQQNEITIFMPSKKNDYIGSKTGSKPQEEFMVSYGTWGDWFTDDAKPNPAKSDFGQWLKSDYKNILDPGIRRYQVIGCVKSNNPWDCPFFSHGGQGTIINVVNQNHPTYREQKINQVK